MPSRNLLGVSRRPLLAAAVLSAVCIVPVRAQQCVADSSARVAEPYVGGGTAEDADEGDAGARWVRDVRTRFRGTDSVRYEMRRAPATHRQQFESIEPLYLGHGR